MIMSILYSIYYNCYIINVIQKLNKNMWFYIKTCKKKWKIKIKSKYCKLDDVYKEKLGVIINIIRFQDNTFNNGWYAYDVLFENISDTYRFYRKEFDIVEAIWVNERIVYIQ